jgi:hypothetical protein
VDHLLEYLRKGILPGPDRDIKTAAVLSDTSPLLLDFGGGTFKRDDKTGKYYLKCENPTKHMMLGTYCTTFTMHKRD